MVATSKNEPNAVVSSKVEALYDSYPFPPGMLLPSFFLRYVDSAFSGLMPCCVSRLYCVIIILGRSLFLLCFFCLLSC